MSLLLLLGVNTKMEAISSEVNFFEQPIIQTTVLNEFDFPVSPLSTIQQGAPIEFEIEAVPDLYVDLNNTKLEAQIKLTRSNGTNLQAADHVGVVNLMVHSLFRNVEMELDSKRLTDSNNLYPYRAILETILNYPKEVLDTRMLCEGWVKDTAEQMDVTNPAGANSGLKTRTKAYAQSNVVRLMGRLHLDLFHQEKILPSMAKIKIRMIPHKYPFVLKTAAPTGSDAQHEYKYEISSITLYVRLKQISPSLLVAHQKMAQEVNYRIPFTRVLMKSHTIGTGVSNVQIENLYTGQLPYRIVAVMVHDQSINGGYNSNPFNFQHFILNFIVLRINGEQVPRRALEPNFTSNDYFRDYSFILDALGYDNGQSSWNLTPTEWANGYTIYVFKTAPGSIGSVKSPPRSGTMGLELKFSVATTHNINLVLLAEYSALVELDRYFHSIS